MDYMSLERFVQSSVKSLHDQDYQLYQLLQSEHQRQNEVLWLVASSYMSDSSVLATGAMSIGNVTTDGYPGKRYLPGCEFADKIEQLAIERAKVVFQAQHANVQPHSGTSANQSIIFQFLEAGDTFMGMNLKAGGHLTHGSKTSVLGKFLHSVTYGVNQEGWIDYDEIRKVALQTKPKLIIAGASAYSRAIDYKKFRAIADEVDAYLLADISHISGLVAAGELPSPINDAHFTTASTYKQLCGPKGGLILLGKDGWKNVQNKNETLISFVDQGVAPFFQDTPNLTAIAGKARALSVVATQSFKEIARRITWSSMLISQELISRGYRLLANGSDNHLILIDLRPKGITGVIAEQVLEECYIIANRNPVPFDANPPLIAGGLRFGTNIISQRKFNKNAITRSVELIDQVLSNVRIVNNTNYVLPDDVKKNVRIEIIKLCRDFPVPGYLDE